MLASTERRIELSDGATTSLEMWGESGPIVLCIHGLGSSRRGWLRTAQHLAASYRIAAYDQRGHGDSFDVDGPMAFERCVQDCLDVVRALGEPLRALAGHSWGGAVAVAAGRRAAAERVCAIDPMLRVAPGTWKNSVIPEYARSLAGTPEDRVRVIREMYAAYPAVELDAKIHAVRHLRLEPIVALGDDNRIDEGGWDHTGLLVDYPAPLLLMLADVTRSVFSDEERAFAHARGGDRIRTDVFAGEGHSLQRSAFDRYAATFEAFIS